MALKNWLTNCGHDAIHTRDLPEKNLTDDQEIIRVAEKSGRIVVSKDSDFHKQHVLFGRPERVLMITTGNIVNKELIKLFENNFDAIRQAFEDEYKLVELSNSSIIIHE